MSAPDHLLQDYLDGLLSEGAASEAEAIAPAAMAAPAASAKARSEKPVDLALDEHKQQLQRLLHSARLQVEQAVDLDALAPVEPAHPAVEVEAPLVAAEADIAALQQHLEWHSNGRPMWAQQQFDVLLFKVSGLTLAVPLIALGQIQPITEELTPLFGQADWFMGLQPTAGGKIGRAHV